MAPHAEDGVGHANGFDVKTAPKDLFVVSSPNVEYTEETIRSKYTYRTTDVTKNADGKYVAIPKETLYDFKVDRKIPKTGVMLVGWAATMALRSPLVSSRTSETSFGRPRRASAALTTMARSSWDLPLSSASIARLVRRSTFHFMTSCLWSTPTTLSSVGGTLAG